jgi:hypothetical protein
MSEIEATPKKSRQSRAPASKKVFVIQVNVVFTIAGPDRLAVESMVTQALAKLKFPGCQDRQLKWRGAFTQEEYAALRSNGKREKAA